MFLAIDIGGTDIKYAIINDKLDIIEQQQLPTAKHNLKQMITEQIDHIVTTFLISAVNVKGIGISTAGVVDSETGEIVYAGPTMPSYIGTNLKHWIETHYHVPVVVMNDVNAAALGEKWLGAAKGFRNFLCMTLGTGIGGALVINDELYIGTHFKAGEIGHIPFQIHEKMSYEQKASMSALMNRAKLELNFIGTGKQLFDEAKNGNLAINQLIDDWTKDIAIGLVPILCTLDCEAVVIGGAVSRQGSYLINKIADQLQHVKTASLTTPQIIAASLGNDAALYGVIYAFQNTTLSSKTRR